MNAIFPSKAQINQKSMNYFRQRLIFWPPTPYGRWQRLDFLPPTLANAANAYLSHRQRRWRRWGYFPVLFGTS